MPLFGMLTGCGSNGIPPSGKRTFTGTGSTSQSRAESSRDRSSNGKQGLRLSRGPYEAGAVEPSAGHSARDSSR